jgi:hypothetical protein
MRRRRRNLDCGDHGPGLFEILLPLVALPDDFEQTVWLSAVDRPLRRAFWGKECGGCGRRFRRGERTVLGLDGNGEWVRVAAICCAYKLSARVSDETMAEAMAAWARLRT